MAVRYNKKLNTEINRVVNNFNSKINRLSKKDSTLPLPQKVSIKQLKKEVTNRAELKRYLGKLSRFSERGAEKVIRTSGGVELTKYEIQETRREARRLKASLTRRINQLGNTVPTVFGIKQSATYAQMGLEQLSNLKARRRSLEKDITMLSKQELKDYQKQLKINKEKEKYRAEQFMTSYTDKMLFDLGYYVGYDKEKIQYIKNKLMELDEQQFLKLFETDEGIRAIKDYYPESHRKNMEKIRNEVTMLYDQLYSNIDKLVEDYKK